MSGLRPHLRLFGLALMAIAGMLSMAGEASARSCCVSSSPTDCCCRASDSAPSTTPAIPSIGKILHASADAPCACRADEPTAPASKPEPSSTGRRTDRVGDLVGEHILSGRFSAIRAFPASTIDLLPHLSSTYLTPHLRI